MRRTVGIIRGWCWFTDRTPKAETPTMTHDAHVATQPTGNAGCKGPRVQEATLPEAGTVSGWS